MLRYAVKALLILLLFPVYGWTTDYYVAPSAVGSNNCTDGNECTLATANAAVNGSGNDVVIMAAGTYTTGIVPATSGASDSPITYTVAAGATVTITASPGIDLQAGQDYITIQKGDGAALNFWNTTRAVYAIDADYLIIDGIDVSHSTSATLSWGNILRFELCDHMTVKNSFFEWDYQTNRSIDLFAMRACKYFDIGPNNVFGDSTHVILDIRRDCSNGRVHNNTFNNEWRHGLGIGDITTLIGQPGNIPQDIIIENNLLLEVGKLTNQNPSLEDRGRPVAALYVHGKQIITRNNINFKCDLANHFYEAYHNITDNWYYHNTTYKPQKYGSISSAEEGTIIDMAAFGYSYSRGRWINNIFDDYGVHDQWTMILNEPLVDSVFRNNILCTSNFEARYNNSSYYTFATLDDVFTGFTDNINSAPVFVNAENMDFSLGTGSPGLATGEFLATIQSINTETDVITLGSYEGYAFAASDFNIPNFYGDTVYAQDGVSARVASRTSNSITVDDASVFSVGDTLTVIEFSGVAPDIGIGKSSAAPPGESPIYTGWYNSSGTPITTPSRVSLAEADRTYLRKFTATSDGAAYSVRLYIGNQFSVNYAWAVAYKMVGTTLTLIGYAPITSPTLNAWSNEIVLLEPASEDMTFSSGTDVYWGIQVAPSGTVEIGRESTGGPGLYYSEKTISGAVITELLNTDMETPYLSYNPAYVFGYTISDDTDDPTVTITSPTADAEYNSPAGSITVNLSGTCSDESSHVVSITWADNHGNSGFGSVADPWTSWSINNLVLAAGSTAITVTAKDSSDNTNTDAITVTFIGPDDTLVGWDSSDNPPDDAITSSALVSTDRVYLRPAWTAPAGGEITGLFWYVGDTWGPTRAWIVAYKVSGANYVLLSKETIPAVALSSYNYLRFYTAESGQSLRFAENDQILYGIAFDAGTGIKYGRNTTGGAGMIWLDVEDLSGGPTDIVIADVDTQADSDIGFTLVYDSLPADVTSPSVVITTPSASTLSLLSNHYTIVGTASDETALDGVYWSCTESDTGDALIISDGAWTLPIQLIPDDNTIIIRAVDATGNIAEDTVVITYTHNVFGGSCSGSF